MLKKTSARKLLTLGLLIVCILSCLLLSSCGCKHQWTDANCDAPKTCSKCGAVEGEPLNHDWAEATCKAPKTCTRCQKTEGYRLNEHDYLDATTEAPKTCSVCGKTKGDPIITDSRFKTEACKALFGTWTGRAFLTGDDIDLPDFKGEMAVDYTITFNHDGTFKESMVLADKAGFTSDLEDYYVETLYAEFANQGMSKTQADEAMLQTYGMDVEAYAKLAAVAVDWDALWAASAPSGVYYVSSGGYLFSDSDWKPLMEKDSFTVTETTLEIESLTEELGIVFHKVPTE